MSLLSLDKEIGTHLCNIEWGLFRSSYHPISIHEWDKVSLNGKRPMALEPYE